MKFRRRGINQKKEYNIQNTAEVWKQSITFIHSNDGLILYRSESISFIYSKYGLTLYIYEPNRDPVTNCSIANIHSTEFNRNRFSFLSNSHTDVRMDRHGIYLYELISYHISISERSDW
jgi:hypothetical protein